MPIHRIRPLGAPPEPISPSDCCISLRGCQEECRRNYILQAQNPEDGAAARAGEGLNACLNACDRESPCSKAP